MTEVEGMPNPLSREHVALYWGCDMDTFGDKSYQRIMSRGYFVVNLGKKHYKLPSAVIKELHPAMVEHSAFLSQKG